MTDEGSRKVPRRSAGPDFEDHLPPPEPHSGRRIMPDPQPEQPTRVGRRFAPPEEELLPEEFLPAEFLPAEQVAEEPTWVSPPPAPQPTATRTSRRNWLLLPGVGVLLIAVVVAGWFLIGRQYFSTNSASTSPEGSISPSPSPTPSASPDPENTEGAPEAVGELIVNDTSLTAPPGWLLYGDESIENDRRVIRLSHAETDVRLQVATLPESAGDVAAACEALSLSQQELFTDVTPSPTLGIGVDPAQGSGVTCGFHGTRSGDGVANTVTFTVVLRVSDGHLLSLRSMIPDSLDNGPSSEQARGDLAAMNCAASRNFQVMLPLC